MCFQTECLLLRRYCHCLCDVVKGLAVAICPYTHMESVVAVVFQCKIVFVQKLYHWYKYCGFLLARLYNHQIACSTDPELFKADLL